MTDVTVGVTVDIKHDGKKGAKNSSKPKQTSYVKTHNEICDLLDLPVDKKLPNYYYVIGLMAGFTAIAIEFFALPVYAVFAILGGIALAAQFIPSVKTNAAFVLLTVIGSAAFALTFYYALPATVGSSLAITALFTGVAIAAFFRAIYSLYQMKKEQPQAKEVAGEDKDGAKDLEHTKSNRYGLKFFVSLLTCAAGLIYAYFSAINFHSVTPIAYATGPLGFIAPALLMAALSIEIPFMIYDAFKKKHYREAGLFIISLALTPIAIFPGVAAFLPFGIGFALPVTIGFFAWALLTKFYNDQPTATNARKNLNTAVQKLNAYTETQAKPEQTPNYAEMPLIVRDWMQMGKLRRLMLPGEQAIPGVAPAPSRFAISIKEAKTTEEKETVTMIEISSDDSKFIEYLRAEHKKLNNDIEGTSKAVEATLSIDELMKLRYTVEEYERGLEAIETAFLELDKKRDDIKGDLKGCVDTHQEIERLRAKIDLRIAFLQTPAGVELRRKYAMDKLEQFNNDLKALDQEVDNTINSKARSADALDDLDGIKKGYYDRLNVIQDGISGLRGKGVDADVISAGLKHCDNTRNNIGSLGDLIQNKIAELQAEEKARRDAEEAERKRKEEEAAEKAKKEAKDKLKQFNDDLKALDQDVDNTINSKARSAGALDDLDGIKKGYYDRLNVIQDGISGLRGKGVDADVISEGLKHCDNTRNNIGSLGDLIQKKIAELQAEEKARRDAEEAAKAAAEMKSLNGQLDQLDKEVENTKKSIDDAKDETALIALSDTKKGYLESLGTIQDGIGILLGKGIDVNEGLQHCRRTRANIGLLDGLIKDKRTELQAGEKARRDAEEKAAAERKRKEAEETRRKAEEDEKKRKAAEEVERKAKEGIDKYGQDYEKIKNNVDTIENDIKKLKDPITPSAIAPIIKSLENDKKSLGPVSDFCESSTSAKAIELGGKCKVLNSRIEGLIALLTYPERAKIILKQIDDTVNNKRKELKLSVGVKVSPTQQQQIDDALRHMLLQHYSSDTDKTWYQEFLEVDEAMKKASGQIEAAPDFLKAQVNGVCSRLINHGPEVRSLCVAYKDGKDASPMGTTPPKVLDTGSSAVGGRVTRESSSILSAILEDDGNNEEKEKTVTELKS